MIIQVAGTSGSGKSHLMRSVIAHFEGKTLGMLPTKHQVPGRSSPLSYLYPTKEQLGRDTLIMGAYETPTGGCDTINDVSQIFARVKAYHDKRCHVLFEGLFCMNQTRGPQLAEEVGKDYHILQLTTPLAQCMASINERRAERGAGELANKKNTEDNYRRATNFCLRMRDAGARVHRVSRDEALDKIWELLGVS